MKSIKKMLQNLEKRIEKYLNILIEEKNFIRSKKNELNKV